MLQQMSSFIRRQVCSNDKNTESSLSSQGKGASLLGSGHSLCVRTTGEESIPSVLSDQGVVHEWKKTHSLQATCKIHVDMLYSNSEAREN